MGIARLVPPIAIASLAAGAHGLLIEVHPDPPNALSDGAQSLDCDQFEELMRRACAGCRICRAAPPEGDTQPTSTAIGEFEQPRAVRSSKSGVKLA